MITNTAAVEADLALRPFHVDIAEEAIVDLGQRIAAWRPPEREVDDQSQAVQLATVQDLANYWATECDWRRCEAKLVGDGGFHQIGRKDIVSEVFSVVPTTVYSHAKGDPFGQTRRRF